MPILYDPIPPSDVTAAEAAAGLARLQRGQFIESTVNTSPWLHEILQMRTRGEITLRGAVYLVLYILTAHGGSSTAHLWANLSAAEILGQVDASTLTRDCLRKLVEDGQSLYLLVTTHNVKTAKALDDSTRARKNAAKSLCGPNADAWLVWYDRVAHALVPYVST